jgi:excisionase family DNA binding protein
MSDVAAHVGSFGAMSVAEFAEYARICESSVWKQIRERRLAARKLGRRTVILKEDAEAYLRDLPRIGAAA